MRGRKYFVKTAGRPDHTTAALTHAGRVELLRSTERLSKSCSHQALVPLLRVIESPEGPLLVYAWAQGALVRSVQPRFRALPVEEILRVLDAVYELHRDLARTGWVASDFYDGCLLYDFEARGLMVMDLDSYHIPYPNLEQRPPPAPPAHANGNSGLFIFASLPPQS
ncbi:MAG: hypothetical protein HY291_19195 [Planctomycetes bacterium]|nr:hypothetical protein [Planctomycetota bacterium]